MKTIDYTGRSKLIARIVHLLNRKAPLPLDGDGDAEWGTNGQVLTTDGNGNTSWTTPQGGGGDVTDVEVNGTSVVNAQGVAEVSVPTKTSDLNNDSGFITNLVNNLANYYTKSQTYTQAEVNALISGIVTLNILVVQALPTQDISTTTIYLVPKQDTGTDDIYDEYLYINNAWELIGTTQIDLSNYVTTTDLSTALADYVTSVGLATILADYVQSSDLATVATSGSYNDLSNKPTIPTVNDGTLTIQQNGTTLGTFTANQSGNTTVNLTGGGSTYTEGDGIDISSQNVISVDTTFTEASTRANIASGETLATILGKIKKFFTDLKTVAFTGSYNDLSDQPTIPADNSVRDYNNSTPTKFGYSTSGMAQSAVTWLGAWDDSVSGEYRLRAVKQADLRVAYAASAGSVAWGNVSGKPNLMYAEYALTRSVGSVVVTHNATGRASMIAFGNGNSTPWFMEIMVHPDTVMCVISCANAAKVGVRRIDSTHFAIISGNWDGVTVASRDNAISAFSVATSSTQYTIDTSVSYFPYASSAGSVTHDTINILSPVGYVIAPNTTLDAGAFTYAIVSAYNNDQSTSTPVIVYENNTFTMKIYNATQTFTVTSKRYIKNNSGSNYLYALCFKLNTVWTS